jgi:hypothetical protein
MRKMYVLYVKLLVKGVSNRILNYINDGLINFVVPIIHL